MYMYMHMYIYMCGRHKNRTYSCFKTSDMFGWMYGTCVNPNPEQFNTLVTLSQWHPLDRSVSNVPCASAGSGERAKRDKYDHHSRQTGHRKAKDGGRTTLLFRASVLLVLQVAIARRLNTNCHKPVSQTIRSLARCSRHNNTGPGQLEFNYKAFQYPAHCAASHIIS